MSSKIIIGLVLFTLAVIAGAYILLSGSEKPSVTVATYSASDRDRPVAEVKETRADLGKIKVSDEKSREFVIKNTGTKPLQLSNISSSCGCTVGQIIYKGEISEEFGMHKQSDYVANIAANTEAKVKVTYRPFVMPVYGVVEREVYVTTNDPNNKKLTFKVKAYVF